MFSIIISEKGGAERKETFDKGEINVGRVQGNDLMLPKGNVSKHHARLLYRDGRFIVSDLKSTNGTYVNGRKIAQATIVREGDKIYIGDFVLRLDGASASAAPGLSAPLPQEGERVNGGSSAGSSAPQQASASGSDASPPAGGGRPAVGSSPARNEMVPAGRAAAGRPGNQSHGQTMPLNVPRAVAAAPAASPRAETVHGSPPFIPSAVAPPAPEPAVPAAPPPASPAPRAEAPLAMPSVITAHAYPAAARPSPRREPEAASHRGAASPLAGLVARILRAVDLPAEGPPTAVDAALSNAINAASQSQLAALRESSGLPAGIDGEELARAAWRELSGLGPLERLLGDPEVTAVHFPRYDVGFVVRAGASSRVDTVFTTDEALARTVLRLAERVGVPRRSGELVLERRLAEGFDLVAIAPPLAPVHGLLLRRHASIAPSLDDWSREGVLTRSMADVLEACVRGRARLLVCGPPALASDFLAALASGVGPEDEVVLVGAGVTAGLQSMPPRAIQVDPTGVTPEQAFAAALRLRPDLLVVEAGKGGLPLAAILEQGTGGGLLVTAPGDTLRRALDQGALSLSVSRPGLSLAGAREVLGSAFDLAIEISETAERRPRVTCISELVADGSGSGTRDVFTYSAAAGFASHGVVPRVIGDLARRGFTLDEAVFKRGAD